MKNIYIKISKNLYQEGIPLGRGYGEQSARPVFDGLFFVKYSAPHIEGDATITVQVMGNISTAPTYKFAGVLMQSSVIDIFLPSSDLINSIQSVFYEYLKDTKHPLPEKQINMIVSRLVSDIINNVPTKSIYKTLREENPSAYSKVETAYFSKTKRHIIQDLEELQKRQHTYEYQIESSGDSAKAVEEYPEYINRLEQKLRSRKDVASLDGSFIKLAQTRDFKSGELVQLNFNKIDERKLEEKDAKNLKALREYTLKQIQKYNLNPKVFSFKRKTVNPDFYQISGIEKDSDGDQVYTINVWKGFVEKAKNLSNQMVAQELAKEVGMSDKDASRMNRYAEEYGLRPEELVAYIKDAKNKGFFKGGFTKEEFDRYYSKPGTNVYERSEQYGVTPEQYVKDLRAAGEQGMSYEEYLQSAQDEKKEEAKSQKEKSGLGLDQDDLEEAAKKYGKDPDELLEIVRRAKKLGLFVDDLFRHADENDISLEEVIGAQHYVQEAMAEGEDIDFQEALDRYLKENKALAKNVSTKALAGGYEAVKNKDKILQAYKNYEDADQLEKLPAEFRDVAKKLGDPAYVASAILEHFQMNPKTFQNKERAIHNYYKIRDMLRQLTADKVEPPKEMVTVYKQITPIAQDRIIAEEFQRNGIPTGFFKNTAGAEKFKDKIIQAYNNIKSRDKEFNNPKLEKLVQIVNSKQQAAPQQQGPQAEQGQQTTEAIPQAPSGEMAQ
jgi:hypothetical protein